MQWILFILFKVNREITSFLVLSSFHSLCFAASPPAENGTTARCANQVGQHQVHSDRGDAEMLGVQALHAREKGETEGEVSRLSHRCEAVVGSAWNLLREVREGNSEDPGQSESWAVANIQK